MPPFTDLATGSWEAGSNTMGSSDLLQLFLCSYYHLIASPSTPHLGNSFRRVAFVEMPVVVINYEQGFFFLFPLWQKVLRHYPFRHFDCTCLTYKQVRNMSVWCVTDWWMSCLVMLSGNDSSACIGWFSSIVNCLWCWLISSLFSLFGNVEAGEHEISLLQDVVSLVTTWHSTSRLIPLLLVTTYHIRIIKIPSIFFNQLTDRSITLGSDSWEEWTERRSRGWSVLKLLINFLIIVIAACHASALKHLQTFLLTSSNLRLHLSTP